MPKNFVMLVVLDGFGISESKEGNAIYTANTPNLDYYFKNYPNTKLIPSGLAVGLPEGQMGNSEVGHLNIGAGRIVYQELTRISKEIKEGEFFKKQEFLDAIENVKKNGSKLHLFGLLSDGGVHSHITHLFALMKLAKEQGLNEVYVHAFLDGRDVPPACAKEYVKSFEDESNRLGIGKIATIAGRYYAMDRDKRWDRTKKAYDAIALGKGVFANSPEEAIDIAYSKDQTDEFVEPTVILENEKPTATVDANDSIIFFNFRPDRARQITRAFIDEVFNYFEREKGYIPVYFVSMTQYDITFENIHVAYKPENLKNTLGEYLSDKGIKQLRIAETEKYAHVTFFFNGGVEEPNKGEDRILIPSPKVATYDLKPEMSAYEVTDTVVEKIKSNQYGFILLNFANPDMVGHTGVFNAAVKAIEAIDECVGRIVRACQEVGGTILITADHGNSEQMIDPVTKEPQTAHTTNPVPFIVIGEGDVTLRNDGILADIAPTVLDIMGLPKPQEMTGKSLIIGR
ncbi:2,3-bisphosphoglycerate-independent phosphoglycerate mutase [Thermoanaerobacterium sp. CMT5567-10]|uniref:2,3-bisphosphoglycerate-independent phosphoglycerate mutase n=1 Tax=Thermoanaerobacterium sp. CMT5567-10 TaxID=3061989 RepID=UPI0026E0AE2F|nr:2,3-bisphosphoglycerate-independent phosphoglycerate mutase [Thermoanaerobacterium sp. CMT5567-10]WKV09681.1 2,3-bisphosphoglycerate-independent phosphoglycerate mutase [Thermoanaerobacterium sp. CMT5567-10]